MVYSDHGCQTLSEPVVVTLQLTVVLPHVWPNQGLVLPQSIMAPVGVTSATYLLSFTGSQNMTFYLPRNIKTMTLLNKCS